MGLALVVGLFAGAQPAAASGRDPGYQLKIVLPEPKASPIQEGGQAAGLRAVVPGRVGLTAADFRVKQTDVDPPLVIEATQSVTYRESDEPMALVLLVQGNFRWIGNESYTDPSDPEAGSVYDGAFVGLGPAIDVLAKAGAAGSKAAFLVYAESKVTVAQAMADAASLSSSVLGSQKDYSEFISHPLALGLTEAWKLLANMPGYRKVLVVIGSGEDDKEDISAEIKKVVGDLKETGVEAYTIFYAAMPDDGPQGQQNMAKIGYTDHLTATSRENFAAMAGTIVEALNAKYYVDFPGEKMMWDGTEHEFVLSVSNQDRGPVNLILPSAVVPAPGEGSTWWIWLLVIFGLIVLIVIVVILIKRRPVDQVMPVAPPIPAGPVKTMMLGVGGNEDSLPIVGWVIPLVGSNQFQTFKLGQGSTVLGTGGASQVIIGDSFMSAEHAEIVCSASGFVINDLGSTNGTYVNSRRVSSYELVDNDVFKLGKTDFKFKSTN